MAYDPIYAHEYYLKHKKSKGTKKTSLASSIKSAKKTTLSSGSSSYERTPLVSKKKKKKKSEFSSPGKIYWSR